MSRLSVDNLPQGITVLLGQWSVGEQDALDRLMDLLYEHLHAEAGRHMRSLHVKGNTIQATMLVNEAYLKFRKRSEAPSMDREHFFWLASRMIREIIVDHIRARTAKKRSRDEQVSLEGYGDSLPGKSEGGQMDTDTFLALNQAIDELERINPRRCQVVVLRYIMGSSIPETAKIMGLSATTVKDEWAAAKAWLFKRLH